jgi:hypothetical protein
MSNHNVSKRGGHGRTDSRTHNDLNFSSSSLQSLVTDNNNNNNNNNNSDTNNNISNSNSNLNYNSNEKSKDQRPLTPYLRNPNTSSSSSSTASNSYSYSSHLSAANNNASMNAESDNNQYYANASSLSVVDQTSISQIQSSNYGGNNSIRDSYPRLNTEAALSPQFQNRMNNNVNINPTYHPYESQLYSSVSPFTNVHTNPINTFHQLNQGQTTTFSSNPTSSSSGFPITPSTVASSSATFMPFNTSTSQSIPMTPSTSSNISIAMTTTTSSTGTALDTLSSTQPPPSATTGGEDNPHGKHVTLSNPVQITLQLTFASFVSMAERKLNALLYLKSSTDLNVDVCSSLKQGNDAEFDGYSIFHLSPFPSHAISSY